MSHHRRQHTRLQSRIYQSEESPEAKRNRLQPCNRQSRRKPRRGRQAQWQSHEDLEYEVCPNPHCKPRQMGRGRYSWEWSHRLTFGIFGIGGRTDIVGCWGCGIVVPRINELPAPTLGQTMPTEVA